MARQSADSESPDLTARIDALFADIRTDESPGCALAVSQGGEILYAHGFGLADLEHQIPIVSDSVFNVGSVSKQFTAACAVLLSQDGRLTLDDPVRLHLPELPDYGTPLTLRHLLHHTAGVRDYTTMLLLSDLPFENNYSAERILSLITGQPELNFTPGDKFLYSNAHYYLLGEVVRRVSGRSLAQFAHERIFGPLGMHDTHFHDDWRRLVPRRAQAYQPGPDGGYVLDISLFDVVGGGGLYSTVLDLARWSRIFTDPSPLGGAAFLDTMLTVGTLNDGTALTYAAGLDVIGEQISHDGEWVGYRSEFLTLPKEALSIICLSNLKGFDVTTRVRNVLALVRGGAPESAGTTLVIETEGSAPILIPEQGELTGQYWSMQSGRVWTVAATSDGLTVEVFGTPMRLKALGSDVFTAHAPAPPGNRLVFERSKGTMRYTSVTERGDVLQRSPTLPESTGELQAYAGNYFNEELTLTWNFAVEDGQLVLKGHRTFGGAWRPLAPGVFVRDNRIARFSQGTSDKLPDLEINAGRVQHLRFRKLP